jgi:RHS repeat-associated protein
MWQSMATGSRQSKHIYVGTERIVTRLGDYRHDTTAFNKINTYYYHGDHLGSAQYVTDWEGEEYERNEYTPYGELWVEKRRDEAIDRMPFKFTGKELDEETGLYYYGARYLDPKASRWLSADPALGEYLPGTGRGRDLPGMGGVYNLVNMQVYHYAGNNPVRYIDPDGRLLLGDDFIFSLVVNLTPLRDDGILKGTWNNFINSWKLIWHLMAHPLQTIWSLPQDILGTLIGYFVVEIGGGIAEEEDGFLYITVPSATRRAITFGSIGMGLGDHDTKVHERGHYYQSLLTSWFYLLFVGLPSILHAIRHDKHCNGQDYFHYWTESSADQLTNEGKPYPW